MMTFTIKTDDIKETELSSIFNEIERKLMDDGYWLDYKVIDAAAHHIYITDTDYVIEY